MDGLLLSFVGNLLIVIGTTGVGCSLAVAFNNRNNKLFWGLLFSIATIITMYNRIYTDAGRYVDFRVIPLTLAGFIGGPPAAVFTAVTTSAFRLYRGGEGTAGGYLGIFAFSYLGCWLGCRWPNMQSWTKKRWLILVFGLPVLVLVSILLLPPWDHSSLLLVQSVAELYLLLLPPAIFLSFKSVSAVYDGMTRQQDQLELERERNIILERLPVTLARFDRSLRLVFANRSAAAVFELEVNQIVGKRILDDVCVSEEFRRLKEERLTTAFKTGKELDYENEITDSAGNLKYFRTFLVPEKDKSGQINTVLSLSYDITEKRQMRERFSKAFHANPLSMAIVSLKTEIFIDVNTSFAEAVSLPREEILGKKYTTVSTESLDVMPIRQKFINEGKLHNFEVQIQTPKGFRTFLLSAEPIKVDNDNCIITILNDITDLRNLQSEMARLDRLNLVGEMAASISHEVRNPLTTVRGYLQWFQAKPSISLHQEQFGLMIGELDRANGIMTEFLSLAKNKAVDMKKDNLNSVLDALFPLIQADALRIGHCVQVSAGDIPDLCMDEKEIRQLILNLVRNGFEAMKPCGAVQIKTYCKDNFIILEVQDNGPGIPEDILSQIGTPFVTTKETGTGLGLPVCYRIADRHGAKIEIDTSAEGSTFRVKFKLG